jgi:hypothetical protein
MRHIIATLAASGGSAISLQIAESLKLKLLEVNLEDSVSVQASLKIFVQIFVQPPRKFSDVRKLTQGTVVVSGAGALEWIASNLWSNNTSETGERKRSVEPRAL